MEADDDPCVLAGAMGTSPRVTSDVPMVRYPEHGTARRRLGRAGLPRVLVVSNGVNPPVSSDMLEDWIRVPCRVGDSEARRAAVLGRYLVRTKGIRIDADAPLRVGGRWVEIPNLERVVLAPLVNHIGATVDRSSSRRSICSLSTTGPSVPAMTR